MKRNDDAAWLLGMLEALAYKLGILIRYELLEDNDGELRLRSGACRLKGRSVIIVDRRLSPQKRCEILIAALREMDLSHVFVPPALRALLDR